MGNLLQAWESAAPLQPGAAGRHSTSADGAVWRAGRPKGPVTARSHARCHQRPPRHTAAGRWKARRWKTVRPPGGAITGGPVAAVAAQYIREMEVRVHCIADTPVWSVWGARGEAELEKHGAGATVRGPAGEAGTRVGGGDGQLRLTVGAGDAHELSRLNAPTTRNSLGIKKRPRHRNFSFRVAESESVSPHPAAGRGPCRNAPQFLPTSVGKSGGFRTSHTERPFRFTVARRGELGLAHSGAASAAPGTPGQLGGQRTQDGGLAGRMNEEVQERASKVIK